MKIAFITFQYPPEISYGGIAIYTKQMAELLVKRGHYVEIFTSTVSSNMSYNDNGIIVNRVLENNNYYFGFSISSFFIDRHNKVKFDLVEGPDYFADSRRIIEMFPELPFVLRIHSPHSLFLRLNHSILNFNELKNIFKDLLYPIIFLKNQFKSKNSFFWNSKLFQILNWDIIERSQLTNISAIACPSYAVMEYVKKYWSVQPHLLKFSPHVFSPSASLLEIEFKTKTANDKITIGFLGRVEEKKGVKLILKSIPFLVKKYPNLYFVFVGRISNEPGTKLEFDKWANINYNRFSKYFKFLGSVDNNLIHEYIKDFDIAVIPSWWENFPNVCLELMSAAKPIIASSNGGMSEMIVDNYSGVLFDFRNCKEFIFKIQNLIEDEKLRMSLGRNARKRVIELYNDEVIGSQIESVYKFAISNKLQNLSIK